jgi:DNA-3-methyladenine glycosylase I
MRHGAPNFGSVCFIRHAHECCSPRRPKAAGASPARSTVAKNLALWRPRPQRSEGAAGLSWSIVLKKRDGYRRAFSQFNPVKVARYSAARIDKLTAEPGIIRNRLKIAAAVKNARAFLAVQKEYGSFDAYCWQFVDGRPQQNRWNSLRQIPATTAESDAFSRDLKRRGFSFVGSTVI